MYRYVIHVDDCCRSPCRQCCQTVTAQTERRRVIYPGIRRRDYCRRYGIFRTSTDRFHRSIDRSRCPTDDLRGHTSHSLGGRSGRSQPRRSPQSCVKASEPLTSLLVHASVRAFGSAPTWNSYASSNTLVFRSGLPVRVQYWRFPLFFSFTPSEWELLSESTRESTFEFLVSLRPCRLRPWRNSSRSCGSGSG